MQRIEQDGIDAGEDRGVSAEADGECEDGGQREAAVLPERSQAQPELPQPAFRSEQIEQTRAFGWPARAGARRQVVREGRPRRHLCERGIPCVLFAGAVLDERHVTRLERRGEFVYDLVVPLVGHICPGEMASDMCGEVTHTRVRRRAGPRP